MMQQIYQSHAARFFGWIERRKFQYKPSGIEVLHKHRGVNGIIFHHNKIKCDFTVARFKKLTPEIRDVFETHFGRGNKFVALFNVGRMNGKLNLKINRKKTNLNSTHNSISY